VDVLVCPLDAVEELFRLAVDLGRVEGTFDLPLRLPVRVFDSLALSTAWSVVLRIGLTMKM
jgi:hypothetical protein